MAAVVAPSSQRLRSSSDPFTDPALKPKKRPPPPPPKQYHNSPNMPSPAPRSAPHDITEAVRETVTVRGSTDYNSHSTTSPTSRTRMGRSQTANPGQPPASSRQPAPPIGRRSQSQDSVTAAAIALEKSKAKRSKTKGSQHADVIDRLDFTGVGPMFHHDGPFDACAPSRNRHRTKAPMLAWSARPDDEQAQIAREYNDNPYPSPHAYAAFSDPYADRAPPQKKKVDAIAEAWGIHEPEPYEEFFAGGGSNKPDTPASSIHNGRESHRNTAKQQRTPAAPKAARRSTLPPPQPIFVPDAVVAADTSGGPDSPGSPNAGFPKRTKSLMHRIRKMRDAPNIPVGNADEYVDDPNNVSEESAGGTRPTHRSQNSFLGRFAGARQQEKPNISPTSEKSESYVFIEPTVRHVPRERPRTPGGATNKDLPATPGSDDKGVGNSPGEYMPSTGYFDESAVGGSGGGNGGLGRKTSLMKKVGRVVRGR